MRRGNRQLGDVLRRLGQESLQQAGSERTRLLVGGRFGLNVDDAVGEALGHRLRSGVVVVLAVGQQGQHVLSGLAGLAGIGAGHRLGEGVEHVGELAHVARIADGSAPWRVHHEHGRLGNQHFVAGHRDQRRRRHRNTVHSHDLAGLGTPERVVDGETIRDAAAVAVDPDVDLRHVGTERVELVDY